MGKEEKKNELINCHCSRNKGFVDGAKDPAALNWIKIDVDQDTIYPHGQTEMKD